MHSSSGLIFFFAIKFDVKFYNQKISVSGVIYVVQNEFFNGNLLIDFLSFSF